MKYQQISEVEFNSLVIYGHMVCTVIDGSSHLPPGYTGIVDKADGVLYLLEHDEEVLCPPYAVHSKYCNLKPGQIFMHRGAYYIKTSDCCITSKFVVYTFDEDLRVWEIGEVSDLLTKIFGE